MKTSEDLTKEKFDRFLAWLHTDRDLAGKKYEVIRCGLMQYFSRRTCHGDFNCPHADELTSETIDRVVSKMDEVTDNYREPERRIFTFAVYVRKEHLRDAAMEPLKPDILDRPDNKREEANEKERQARCHDHCLGRLPEKDRYLITEYFKYTGQERIGRRRDLANELSVTRNYLALIALRLRNALHNCLLECLHKISDPDVMDP
jgi:hypothetical protein